MFVLCDLGSDIRFQNIAWHTVGMQILNAEVSLGEPFKRIKTSLVSSTQQGGRESPC